MSSELSFFRLLIVLVVALAGAGEAQSQDTWLAKLDAEARQLVLAEEPEDVAQRLRTTHDLVVRTDGRVRAGLLVRLDHPQDAVALEAAGFRLETLAGEIAVGTLDVERLPAVARLEVVRAVEVSRYVDLLNDLGNDAINVPQVHAGAGLPQPYRGTGVVIGIIDTGIDFTHPDFSDAAGTRIEYLLEYLPDDDNVPPEAQAEWTADEIDQSPELVTQRDIHGHGTHVAATAAGGGNVSATFLGTAPESRLVVVKASRTGTDPDRPHTFTERDIINGTAYVFDRAAELDLPAVVNLSIGSPGPPLDGSANVNVAMSNLTGAGRIIVFAAGNEGARRLHWGADLAANASATMLPEYGAFVSGCCGETMVIDTWYDPGALESVTVTARDTLTTEALASLTIPIGEQTPGFHLLMGPVAQPIGWVEIDATVLEHPANGDGVIRVWIANMHSETLSLHDHIWTVTLTAAAGGRADAWLVGATMGNFALQQSGVPTFIPGDNLMTLNRLAAGMELLAAGALTTRNEWQDASGNPIAPHFLGQPVPLHTRTYFSSLGPTRDGRVRPDVVAPGAWVASALSSQAPSFGGSIFEEPAYAIAAGTSMAAPFMTGTVALMLQVDPSLTPEEVREIIRSNAMTDAHTGGVPNPEYGFGKLDALAAVQAAVAGLDTATGPIAGAELSLDAPYPNPTRNRASLTFSLPQAGDAQLVIYDLLGREVQRLVDGHMRIGPHRAELDRLGLAAGVYLVVLRAAGEHRARRIVLVD